MVDAMSKKEKLARGSAVIKVMKVIPRPGNYLKFFIDPRKLPKSQAPAAKGILAEMPWLDVKNADFNFTPKSAKIKASEVQTDDKPDPCGFGDLDEGRSPNEIGLPDGDPMMGWFGYRNWLQGMNPLQNGNISEHFNIMLGVIMSLAKDPENQNFVDVEAYPCCQFLRTIKSEEGQIPYNVSQLVGYMEFICQKMVDEG